MMLVVAVHTVRRRATAREYTPANAGAKCVCSGFEHATCDASERCWVGQLSGERARVSFADVWLLGCWRPR